MAALIVDGPMNAARTFLFAHGAGAPMDSPFMNRVAEGVAASGVRVVRFEFPYMQRRREIGEGRAPDPPRVLENSFRDAIDGAGGAKGLVIGGKSMGGRIASLVADEAGVAGLVCLGYPFHPVGKPDKLRVEHLRTIKTPTQILQGERDTFGDRKEVAKYKLSAAIKVKWIKDGNHSFKPRRSSGTTEQENWQAVIDGIETFLL
jgi:uncharacterized protein